MDDFYKINNLKERFKLAIQKTELHQSIFYIRSKYGTRSVEISMPISDESGYPDIVKKEYYDIEELEMLVDTLEKLKMISLNPNYQVQIIPKTNTFDIYINGNQVKVESLDFYVNETQIAMLNQVKDAFLKVYEDARIIRYLYHQINDKQDSIDRCKKLISDLNSPLSTTKKRELINFSIMEELATPVGINNYEIDWNTVLRVMEEYNNSFNSNNPRIIEEANAKLLEQYNNIINAIKSGILIELNTHELYKLKAYQLQYALNFLNKLSKLLEDMTLEATSILESKSSQLEELTSTINGALSHKKDEAIKRIASIQLPTEEAKKEPKIRIDSSVLRLPAGQYSKGSFNAEMDKKANVFQDIQKQQLEKLTSEERDALIYYKSSMYRPINQTIAFLRKNGISLSEVEKDESLYTELISIISKCYESFIKRKQEYEMSLKDARILGRQVGRNPRSVERLFGRYPNETPNRMEYIGITLSSIPLLESALSKIKTTEDIVVYRGVNNQNPGIESDGRFLSTTISLDKAKFFLDSEDRKTENKPVFPDIYQIVIPKGSSVIAFTDDLLHDRYEEGRVFNEEQQEILIDPINFDFQNTYINAKTLVDGREVIRVNCKAIPKARTLEQTQNRTM